MAFIAFIAYPLRLFRQIAATPPVYRQKIDFTEDQILTSEDLEYLKGKTVSLKYKPPLEEYEDGHSYYYSGNLAIVIHKEDGTFQRFCSQNVTDRQYTISKYNEKKKYQFKAPVMVDGSKLSLEELHQLQPFVVDEIRMGDLQERFDEKPVYVIDSDKIICIRRMMCRL